jgi:phospholipid N-methyltransferase
MMTSQIDPTDGPVIELGAGTGVFTRALLARGVREQDLVLVETNRQLANMLRKRFPAAHVICADAAELGSHYPLGRTKAGSVVSGLPLLSMPEEQVIDILQIAFLLLRRGGRFFQFTYGFGTPVPLHSLQFTGLHAKRIGWVAANLPPASVYQFSASSQ